MREIIIQRQKRRGPEMHLPTTSTSIRAAAAAEAVEATVQTSGTLTTAITMTKESLDAKKIMHTTSAVVTSSQPRDVDFVSAQQQESHRKQREQQQQWQQANLVNGQRSFRRFQGLIPRQLSRCRPQPHVETRYAHPKRAGDPMCVVFGRMPNPHFGRCCRCSSSFSSSHETWSTI